jgi:4-amino-4-deoxy-L-arabinose transferase-like glycosyltransferase
MLSDTNAFRPGAAHLNGTMTALGYIDAMRFHAESKKTFSACRLEDLRAMWPWLPLWVVVAAIAIFQHGPMPMFSTRALSVAWEMWHRHSFLVPYLNGVPYSEKAPLLFWLIQLGWAIGGVGDVWPRSLEVMFGGTQLVLVAILARRLFPERPWLARATPWLLLTFTYGFLFGLQVMYEVLLAVCVLAALLALVPAPCRDGPRFVWFALAVGLGLLTKGPVMLLHVAFPWLLGPLWSAWAQRERRRWYLHGALALLAGCGMLLAWALLAARAGGATYRDQLLFHQTAGRVVNAFAHAKPLWWYLPLLPILVFPFALWPRLWVAVCALRRPFEPGLRFVFAWLGPVLLAFSLVSGKQPYYLLPEYAGFALLIAAALAHLQQRHAALANSPWLGPWPLALLSLALAMALIMLPQLVKGGLVREPQFIALASISVRFGVIYVLLGLLLLVRGSGELPRIAFAGLFGAVAANGLFSMTLWPAFNLKPASELLTRAEARGQPIANLESYDGQFHFLGRLTRRIEPLHNGRELQDWAKAHPTGLIITYPPSLTPADLHDAVYVQPFRGVWLAIWPAPALAATRTDRLTPNSLP